ncbi:MAG: hypothetical protein KDD56_02980, partial [Bdellovibrionales bacterium]|nr:hypothetical protein [Bdellovibrionales bacterium]
MTPDQNPRTSSQENLDFFFDIQKFNAGESEFKNKGYYRTSKPISVSIPIGKFDKSSDKPIRIDVTSFLL